MWMRFMTVFLHSGLISVFNIPIKMWDMFRLSTEFEHKPKK